MNPSLVSVTYNEIIETDDDYVRLAEANRRTISPRRAYSIRGQTEGLLARVFGDEGTQKGMSLHDAEIWRVNDNQSALFVSPWVRRILLVPAETWRKELALRWGCVSPAHRSLWGEGKPPVWGSAPWLMTDKERYARTMCFFGMGHVHDSVMAAPPNGGVKLLAQAPPCLAVAVDQALETNGAARLAWIWSPKAAELVSSIGNRNEHVAFYVGLAEASQ